MRRASRLSRTYAEHHRSQSAASALQGPSHCTHNPGTSGAHRRDRASQQKYWLLIALVGVSLINLRSPASELNSKEPMQPSIIVADNRAELTQKFCKADPTTEHIVVLPTSLFVDSEEVICPGGPYKLYRIINYYDQDDFDYYLDPPFGSSKRLGCDGKGGRSMTLVAVNCRPE